MGNLANLFVFQATIEDLDLLPALTIAPETPLSQALEISYEREYSYLPVVSTKNKRLLGYLTAELLQNASKESGSSDDLVKNHYVRFFGPKKPSAGGSADRAFLKITPSTPLEDLELFFGSREEFAVVTDDDRRFVLGVATKEDLDKFVKNRPSLKV